MVRRRQKRNGNWRKRRLQIVSNVAEQQVHASETQEAGRAQCGRIACRKAQALKNAIESLKCELTCSLSLEMYHDPVSTETGSIYERKYIVEWLSRKKSKGESLLDPCTGLMITPLLTPITTLKQLIEMVKDNCLELEINFVEKVQKQAQAIKQRALNIEVIIQMRRDNGGFTSRTYCVRRTKTIGSLKNQFLMDIGLANTKFICVLVEPFSNVELKNDTMLMQNGLRDGAVLHVHGKMTRDGAVLHVHGKMTMSDFYKPFPTAVSQYSSTQVPLQIAVPRAVRSHVVLALERRRSFWAHTEHLRQTWRSNSR